MRNATRGRDRKSSIEVRFRLLTSNQKVVSGRKALRLLLQLFPRRLPPAMTPAFRSGGDRVQRKSSRRHRSNCRWIGPDYSEVAAPLCFGHSLGANKRRRPCPQTASSSPASRAISAACRQAGGGRRRSSRSEGGAQCVNGRHSSPAGVRKSSVACGAGVPIWYRLTVEKRAVLLRTTSSRNSLARRREGDCSQREGRPSGEFRT